MLVVFVSITKRLLGICFNRALNCLYNTSTLSLHVSTDPCYHLQSPSSHLVSQRVPLGGRGDTEQPEDGDIDRGHRSGHRVDPEQVGPVHREAPHQHRGQHGGHEHRGGDDGVSGRHGSDFMVPHVGDFTSQRSKHCRYLHTMCLNC